MADTENIDKKQQIKESLVRLTTYVHDCTKRISMGESVDLSGLDEKTIMLCDDIRALPEGEAAEFAEPMKDLIASIDHMAAQIEPENN